MIHHGVHGSLSVPLFAESPILGEGEVSIVTKWQLPLVAAWCFPPLRDFHFVTTTGQRPPVTRAFVNIYPAP
jgi:hypothetical protein